MAGGTGDIAFRIAERSRGHAEITVADINESMLDVGRERAEKRGLANIAFREANAEALPFADASFDAYTIAFGIRNVPRIEAALAEAFRVLKHGGRFLCLEFSEVDMPMLDRLYELYSFRVIPALGRVVAGDAESYRYLVESIRTFPNQERFADMMRAAGFERVDLPQSLRRHRRAAFRLEALERVSAARSSAARPRRLRAGARRRLRPARARRPAAAARRRPFRLARLLEPRGLTPAERGRRISEALNRLGPSYIKLGQFLATRPDIVGTEMADALGGAEGRPAAVPDGGGARDRRGVDRPARRHRLRELFRFGRRRLDRAGAQGGAPPARRARESSR